MGLGAHKGTIVAATLLPQELTTIIEKLSNDEAAVYDVGARLDFSSVNSPLLAGGFRILSPGHPPWSEKRGVLTSAQEVRMRCLYRASPRWSGVPKPDLAWPLRRSHIVRTIILVCATSSTLSCRSSPAGVRAQGHNRDYNEEHALEPDFINTEELGAGGPCDSVIVVGKRAAIAQGFVAPAERIETLEIFATTTVANHADLVVEIRSPDLAQRIGYGRVPSELYARDLRWDAMVWDVQPELEIGSEYRLVAFTRPGGIWYLGASSADTYVDGELAWGWAPEYQDGDTPVDLALRITFDSGEVIQSGVANPVRRARVYDAYGDDRYGYGLYNHPSGEDSRGRHRHLPHCIDDNHCIDDYNNLLENAEE